MAASAWLHTFACYDVRLRRVGGGAAAPRGRCGVGGGGQEALVQWQRARGRGWLSGGARRVGRHVRRRGRRRRLRRTARALEGLRCSGGGRQLAGLCGRAGGCRRHRSCRVRQCRGAGDGEWLREAAGVWPRVI